MIRFYFRLGRHIGISMPWYIALIFYAFWGMCLTFVILGWLVYQLLKLIYVGLARCYRKAVGWAEGRALRRWIESDPALKAWEWAPLEEDDNP